MDEPSYSPYRWAIIAVAALAHCSWNIMIIQPGGLAMYYFGGGDTLFTPMQFTMCMNAPFLTCGIFGLVFGAIADKRGVRIITIIGTVLGVVGAILRIFAVTSFPALFATSIFLGFGLAALNANAVKLIAAWFPMRQVSTMMGVYIGAATLGAGLALGTGVLFPSLKSAFTASAILAVIVLVLWVLVVKNRPTGVPVPEPEPTIEYLKVVSKKSLIWLAGLAAALFIAFGTVQNGNLTTALTSITGADPGGAAMVGTLVNVAVICGSLFWPWFANKIGRFRIASLGAILAAVFTVLAIFIFPWGGVTFLLYFLIGFCAGGGAPIVMSMPALMPGVGEKYAGSGGGLISTIMNLAAFILPSFVIAPIFGADIRVLFWAVAGGYVLFAVSLFIIPELGRKGKIWKEQSTT
jgi:NNP family nitrate/nitrite transporter-like MFS transporter